MKRQEMGCRTTITYTFEPDEPFTLSTTTQNIAALKDYFINIKEGFISNPENYKEVPLEYYYSICKLLKTIELVDTYGGFIVCKFDHKSLYLTIMFPSMYNMMKFYNDI